MLLINGIDHPVLSYIEIFRKLYHSMIGKKWNILLLCSSLNAFVYIFYCKAGKKFREGEEPSCAVKIQPFGKSSTIPAFNFCITRTILVIP